MIGVDVALLGSVEAHDERIILQKPPGDERIQNGAHKLVESKVWPGIRPDRSPS